MNETKQKNKILSVLWHLCPVRIVILLVFGLWIAFYFAFRANTGWMNAICDAVVRPWHRFAGQLSSRVPFSMAEWIILAAVVVVLLFVIQLLIHLIRKRDREKLFRWAVTFLMILALAFGLFCLWWGVFYYADGFTEQAGLEVRELTTMELRDVTEYFAGLCNRYSVTVKRDKDSIFTPNRDTLFDKSETLYHGVEKLFPCLKGPDMRAKPAFFSRFMSRINYTGYFFPYTAEANLNVDSPLCLLPSTIAHELAHQRGVSGEDEANFVAVAACMESGDPEFLYSGALSAYIYLGNALYSADYNAWLGVYSTLNGLVITDLVDNNEYWEQFKDTAASEVSEKVYEGFLRTYGDDRGMASYGACVDLLVLWYLDAARD